MMCGFHLLMMLLGIIGCRFGDAGLREVAVESNVVAEGSLEKVFSGKHCFVAGLCIFTRLYMKP